MMASDPDYYDGPFIRDITVLTEMEILPVGGYASFLVEALFLVFCYPRCPFLC